MKTFLKNLSLIVVTAVLTFATTLAVAVNAVGNNDDATTWANIKQQLVTGGWTAPVPTPPPAPMQMDAWVYPDPPNITPELTDGRQIYALKAEFLKINDNGTMSQINASASLPNGYSTDNVALYKAHSQEQYITVSDNHVGTEAVMNSSATIPAMVDLVQTTGFTGIELDFERYGEWTPAFYAKYKTFITDLDTALAVNGKKLMVVGPAIWDATSQGWYQWKYEELSPLVDSIIMMVYDYQYDYGVGKSIQPDAWGKSCMAWLKAKANNGIAGIPSYGYKGPNNTYNVTIGSSLSMTKTNPTRNADGELTKLASGTFYDWSDVQTMQARLNRVKDSGFTRLSVWSLGNNPWFE